MLPSNGSDGDRTDVGGTETPVDDPGKALLAVPVVVVPGQVAVLSRAKAQRNVVEFVFRSPGRHVVVGQGSDHLELLIQPSYGKPFQGELDQIDCLHRKAGQIGQGLRTDLLPFPDAAAQENGGVDLLPVGLFDANDVNGSSALIHTTKITCKYRNVNEMIISFCLHF